jgi:hypothetical protein
MPEVQSCQLCKNTLSITDFYPRYGKTGNFQSRDKVCRTCREKQKVARANGNPETYIRRAHIQLRYHRVKAGIPWRIDADFLVSLYHKQNGLCALTGMTMTHQRNRLAKRSLTNISIDRKDSTKGYVPSNIQLVCSAVNLMKGTMSDEQFVTMCKLVVEHHRKKGSLR